MGLYGLATDSLADHKIWQLSKSTTDGISGATAERIYSSREVRLEVEVVTPIGKVEGEGSTPTAIGSRAWHQFWRVSELWNNVILMNRRFADLQKVVKHFVSKRYETSPEARPSKLTATQFVFEQKTRWSESLRALWWKVSNSWDLASTKNLIRPQVC